MNSINILEVRIDDIDKDFFLKQIDRFIQSGKKFFVATPNPEMLVLAKNNKEFKNILNSSAINIPDGVGLKFGAKILGQKLNNRVTGADSMFDILRLAERKNYSVYFLGGRAETARAMAKNFKKYLPKINIVGAEQGSNGEADFDKWDNEVIIKHINSVKPDILFVALGHYKQEKWIFNNLEKLETVKLAMGVGGAFDFYSGKAKRAPKHIQASGFEWLWRLFKEPYRYRRIFTAVVVFSWKCFLERLGK